MHFSPVNLKSLLEHRQVIYVQSILILVIAGLSVYFLDKHIGRSLVTLGSALCFISLIVSWKKNGLNKLNLQQHLWPLTLVFLLCSLFLAWTVHDSDMDFRRLHEAFEISLMGGVLYYFFASRQTLHADHLIGWALSFGLALTGIVAFFLWQKQGYSGRIWQGTSMINISAGTQILLLGSVFAFIFYKFSLLKSLLLFFVIGVGSVGIFASGSRGAWLGMIGLYVVTAFWLISRLNMGRKAIASVVLILSLCVVGLLHTPQVEQRIAHGKYDMKQYFDGGRKTTSLGLRLEMWRSAMDGFLEHPFVGMGGSSVGQRWEGITHEYHLINSSPHVHNDFLEGAQSRGITGLLSVILLLCLPLYMGWKNRQLFLGKTLFTVGSGFLIVCLFDSHLVMKFALFYYVILISISMGVMTNKANTN